MLKKLVYLGVLAALAGCSSSSDLYQWENFSAKNPVLTEKTDANLIFVRDKNLSKDYFVDFFVNDHYVTSLHEDGFKQIQSCNRKQKITVTLNDVKTSKVIGIAIRYIDFSKDKVNVLSVSEQNGKAGIRLIDSNKHQAYLQNLKEQTHTISRVSQAACDFDKNLVFFKFDGHKSNSIVDDGQAKLARMAQEVKQSGSKTIEISGYTDPVGSQAYNLVLSKKRADTVKNLLLKLGVDKSRIVIKAYGKQHLLVNNCSAANNRSEQRQCNQENRRVSVDLN